MVWHMIIFPEGSLYSCLLMSRRKDVVQTWKEAEHAQNNARLPYFRLSHWGGGP